MKYTVMAFVLVSLASVACSSNEDQQELDTARTQAETDFKCSNVDVTLLSPGSVQATGCGQQAHYACNRDRDFWSCARVY